MKQIEVQIMGQGYLLSCPEGGEAALLDAVERVDAAMCRIRDAGKVKARDRIAVLASLNLAFELSASKSKAASVPPIASAADLKACVTMSEEEAAEWSDLLQRLDQTLGADGRLL
jgi:cell division protein ZapA